MQYFKYFCAYSKIAGIKTNTYDRRLSSISVWASIAKQDVPGLKDEDIKVVQYLGDRWASQLGVEFPCQNCPEGYQGVDRLEQAFS